VPRAHVPRINTTDRTDPYSLAVKCQISPNNTILGPEFEEEPGRWACPGAPYSPGCAGGETYVAVHEPKLLARIDSAFQQLAARYGLPQSDEPTLFLLGDHPETTRMTDFGAHWVINLNRNSNFNQFSGQIGHECFHRWCTPPLTFSWVHEMLAEAFKFQYLTRVAMGIYALEYDLGEARANPNAMTAGQLRETTPPFLRNTDFYQGALVVGHDLHETVGEPAMVSLAKSFDADGLPDVDAWLADLPPETASVAAQLLGLKVIELTSEIDLTTETNVKT
jgi:hypothetical protein